MQRNDQSIEQRFGLEVANRRRSVRMSQKTLAELLTSAGLPVDASAISRIEKGTRALRLSEAHLVAQRLGFSLDDLSEVVPPQDEYAGRRKRLDDLLAIVGESCRAAADEANSIDWLIEGNRDQLVLVDEDTTVRTTTDLMGHIEQELRNSTILNSIGTRFRTEDARDAVRSLLTSVAGMSVDSAIGADADE
jgi:transcriptional regulator with XRE-family HTH domain